MKSEANSDTLYEKKQLLHNLKLDLSRAYKLKQMINESSVNSCDLSTYNIKGKMKKIVVCTIDYYHFYK